MDGLEARLSADRLAYADSGTGLDTTDDRAGLQFLYSRGALRIVESNQVQRFVNGGNGLARTTVGPRLTIEDARPLGNGWLLTYAYRVDYSRTEQEVFGTVSGFAEVEVPPVAGLYVNTDLPLDTSSTPMNSDPALVDRNFTDGAGIQLGLAGASFQNVGVDMGRFVPLDLLRIHVRNGAGAPVPFGGPVTWTMYSSADGVRWAPIDGAASFFDVSTSAYLVQFPATSARYFKAVNFGVNTIETIVTELQAFATQAAPPGRPQVSSATLQGFSLSLSGRPLPKLGLRYSGMEA